MRYRTLAGAGCPVSEIGFGVWTVSTTWWGISDDAVGRDLLRKAYEAGITFYDTADTYGNGKGETLLAEALGDKRKQIVIATKVGYDFYNNPGPRRGQEELPQNWSPEYLRSACEQSLSRLQTDHIDLYQLHNPRIDTIRRDDVWETLERLRGEGKIHASGVALGPAIAERQIEEGETAIREQKVPAVQIIYNLLEQMLGQGLFVAGREAGASFLVRVPHASGLLEGKYTTETTFAPTDHRYHRVSDDERKKKWLVDGLKKVEQLAFLTAGTGRTLAQAALKFILAEGNVASVFPNIYNEAQLKEFVAASECPDLDPSEMARITDLCAHDFYLNPAAV